jgi:hypothetical protein
MEPEPQPVSRNSTLMRIGAIEEIMRRVVFAEEQRILSRDKCAIGNVATSRMSNLHYSIIAEQPALIHALVLNDRADLPARVNPPCRSFSFTAAGHRFPLAAQSS